MDDKPIKGFVDGTSWLHEAGNTDIRVYPELEDIEARSCVEECGIVEVEIRLVRWVKEPENEKPGIQAASGREPHDAPSEGG